MIEMKSPNFNKRAVTPLKYIILHYTGMKDADSALKRLCDIDSQVSAHYTVDEQGEIYHHVDESMRAWHAGKGYWNGDFDINSLSIGIEIVNSGHQHGYKKFTDRQIQALIALCCDIQKRHDIKAVLAHSDIAPDRKEDPGELFPWQTLAEENVGVWPLVSDEDFVKSAGIDVIRGLQDLGYKAKTSEKMIIAFQRHFEPEAFVGGTVGIVSSLTKARLYALLARHLIL